MEWLGCSCYVVAGLTEILYDVLLGHIVRGALKHIKIPASFYKHLLNLTLVNEYHQVSINTLADSYNRHLLTHFMRETYDVTALCRSLPITKEHGTET